MLTVPEEIFLFVFCSLISMHGNGMENVHSFFNLLHIWKEDPHLCVLQYFSFSEPCIFGFAYPRFLLPEGVEPDILNTASPSKTHPTTETEVSVFLLMC